MICYSENTSVSTDRGRASCPLTWIQMSYCGLWLHASMPYYTILQLKPSACLPCCEVASHFWVAVSAWALALDFYGVWPLALLLFWHMIVQHILFVPGVLQPWNQIMAFGINPCTWILTYMCLCDSRISFGTDVVKGPISLLAGN